MYDTDPAHINNAQFRKLIEALSHTSLVDSLKHVQYGGNWHHPALTDVQVNSAFRDNGFSVQFENRFSQPIDKVAY